VTIAETALHRVVRAREVVEQVLASGAPVYGMTTGLGALARHPIPLEELERFSFATVADQTGSYGRPLPVPVVRAMMLTRANGMAKAGVGVRRELIELIIALLNARVHPVVRDIGSVGQGDLAQMADIGKVLIGGGLADYRGAVMPGHQALSLAGLGPIRLAPKEALALVSANGLTTGFGSMVLADVADLLDALQVSAALSLEGFAGNLSTIHPAAGELRPHAGEKAAGRRLRELLEGSYLWHPGAARHLQDPLSFRCVPQTHGALYDALGHVRRTMEIELNSAGDSPLVAVEDQAILSVGNFDVVALAASFDFLRIAITAALQVLDERVQKLLWAQFSGLSTGLAATSGATGGLRQLGRACAALTAEARGLANPVSLDYRGQVSEGVEDHASMAPLSVRRTSELVTLAYRIIAFELVVAAQAVDLREGARPLGQGTRAAHEAVRDAVPFLVDETDWAPDIDRLIATAAGAELLRRVARDAGERKPLSDLRGPALEHGDGDTQPS
jgi:histidine ammonia-lyase